VFVRWQTRKSSAPKSWRRTGVHLAAILADNVRVDGKPKQRHIAYLAGVRAEQDIEAIATQCMFWTQVTRKLDGLGKRLSADDRRHIERTLAERVRRPTKREQESYQRKRAAKRIFSTKSVKPC